MFPQFYFLSNPESELDLVVKRQMRKYPQHQKKQAHQKQLIQFYLDEKFIDSPLSKQGYQKIQSIKKEFTDNQQFDIVVVAPLRKSLQTAYELFKDIKLLNSHKKSEQSQKVGTKFYIELLLSDKLNGMHAIGSVNQNNQGKYKQQYQKYKQFFQNIHILSNSSWTHKILPQRIISQLTNDIQLSSGHDYAKLFKIYSSTIQCYSLQSTFEFNERIKKLKNSLVQLKQLGGINKKVLIIGSNETLNILASTGYHQNGEPVNPLDLLPASFEIVNLVIEKEIINFYNNLPFC